MNGGMNYSAWVEVDLNRLNVTNIAFTQATEREQTKIVC